VEDVGLWFLNHADNFAQTFGVEMEAGQDSAVPYFLISQLLPSTEET